MRRSLISKRVLEPLPELDTSSDPVTIVKLYVKGRGVKTETDCTCLQRFASQMPKTEAVR
ncbi:hypothetical protein ACFLSZ_05105 [Candidatus Bipolaricaulota bacterium]